MVRKTALVWNGLSAADQKDTAIFGNDYGESAAVDFFGAKYGLPPAIGNHESYWLWGPRDYSGEIVIVLGGDGVGDRRHFKTVQVMGRADAPYSRSEEHFDIFLCRDLSTDLRAFWPETKKW